MSQPPRNPVTPSDLGSLLLLGALWGGSFLFMRIAAPAFGPWALAWLRVTLAALCLLPWLWRRGQVGLLRQHWRTLLIVALFNSALPFACVSYAMLTLSAGMAAILNATAPLFGAVIAWLWLRQRLDAAGVAGLLVGFAGVAWLVWHRLALPSVDTLHLVLAMAGSLSAAVMYAWGASFTQRYCSDIPSAVIATGSQVFSAVALLPMAVVHRPEVLPDVRAWLAVIAVAALSTAWAYALYFRLIARLGPARAIAVTFLVPAFGMAWGALWLDEEVTGGMIAACAVILAGTALTTGTLRPPRRASP